MRYVLRKLAQTMFVVVVVTFLTSIALRFLPGGTDVIVALKTGPGATPEQAAAVVEELGLDKPMIQQYFSWLGNFVTGDWGTTFRTNQSIATEVKRALPVSLYLMVYGQILALGLAVPTAEMWLPWLLH